MSRIGKLPVEILQGVTVTVNGNTVEVKGPKGTLNKTFDPAVKIAVEDNKVIVSPASDSRFAGAMHGTVRSIINGMVNGVKDGFEKKLEISGVGFNANPSGNKVKLNLGYSHDINYVLPEGVVINVEGGTKLTVSGADKQKVGQAAADIESYYPAEPYKGKGVKIIGKFYRRKEGKKTAK